MADQPPPPYTEMEQGPPGDTSKGAAPPAGYPPQSAPGYPPTMPGPGYPPQPSSGYPPQPAGYPPQQAAYPPQPGYPGQPGYPQKGFAPVASGHPPQGQGYVQQPTGYTATNTTNTVIITQQPQITTIVPTYVHDYMGLSIFSCLCCCWCLGLFAIIKSSESRSFSNAGNYEQAVHSAIQARNLGYASVICGIVIITIAIIAASV